MTAPIVVSTLAATDIDIDSAAVVSSLLDAVINSIDVGDLRRARAAAVEAHRWLYRLVAELESGHVTERGA